MIAFVQGTLSKIEENSVVIDTGAIGYRVFTPITEALMRVGMDRPIKLYTYFSVREDAMQLYGFLTEAELDLFKMLINVNGVGPKFALGLIASLGTDVILFAIAQEDHKTLTKAPGIGAKTAQRIVIDLKDKIKARSKAEDGMGLPELPEMPALSPSDSAVAEAIAALEALGYPHQQAENAVKRIPDLLSKASTNNSSLLVREALKQLAIL